MQLFLSYELKVLDSLIKLISLYRKKTNKLRKSHKPSFRFNPRIEMKTGLGLLIKHTKILVSN